ncbi:hypothetical protein GQ473_03195, partial [archaeon]|nr:hypothetical protein [archaeon]
MAVCDKCGKETGWLPFNCKYCKNNFCSDCRLPENHNCQGLKNGNIFENLVQKPQLKKTESIKLLTPHNKKHKKSGNYKKEKISENKKDSDIPIEKLTYFYKMKSLSKTIDSKIKRWVFMMHRNRYIDVHNILITFFWLVLLLFSSSIIYSNLEKLNEITIVFLRVGSLLYLLTTFYVVKTGMRLIKHFKYIFRYQGNWVKYSIMILFFLLILNAYGTKETFFDPLLEKYNDIDFELLTPFNLTAIFDGASSTQYSLFNAEKMDLYQDPKERKLFYFFDNKRQYINLTVYGGLNDYLKSLPREISYTYTPPTDKDFILRDLNNEKQRIFLESFIRQIKEKTSKNNNRARIAISLVQNIPYDFDGLNTGIINGKYPYEVIYTNKGVCSEKSELLVYILKDLGYGTVIFRFDVENH